MSTSHMPATDSYASRRRIVTYPAAVLLLAAASAGVIVSDRAGAGPVQNPNGSSTTPNMPVYVDATANSCMGIQSQVCANPSDEKDPCLCPTDYLTSYGTSAGGICDTVVMQSGGVNNRVLGVVLQGDDYQPASSASGSGCSSCGGGPTTSAAPAMGLRRVHRYRNEVEAGSFGVGGFSAQTDKRVVFTETGGGIRARVFDPSLNSAIILSDGTEGDARDGVFHDVISASVREANLRDASGNITTQLTQAKWLDVVAYNGQVSRYEVITTSDNSAVNGGTRTDLLAQWTLDEGAGTAAADSTGTAGHAGAFSATTPPVFVGGKSGQSGDSALRFNGTDQGVEIANTSDLNFSGVITMSAWIKPSNTSGFRTILSHGYTTSPNAMTFMQVYNNTLMVGAWPGNYPTVALPADASTRFVHVVATYDGTNWNVYVDGVLKASAADATGARLVNAPWGIGMGTCPTNHDDRRYFQGDIDDVRIYNRALSAAEVADMTAGTDPAATGLLAKWGMDEGSGPTVADATGNTTHAGKLVPTVPQWVAGRSGQSGDNALRFDGTNWLSLGNPSDLNFSGKITLTAWIKTESLEGWRTILGHGYTNSPNAQVAMETYNDQLWFGSWPGANRPVATMPSGLVGNWAHVASEYDGNNWRTYVNGVLYSVTASPVGALQVPAEWRVGSGTKSNDPRRFIGAIDDVRIYNRALSDAEIYQLGGAPKTYGGRLVSIKPLNGYGLDLTYKYNPSTPGDATAIANDPSIQWQVNTSQDAQGNTVTYTYGAQQVAGAWVVSRADFSNGQHTDYVYADGLHLTQVTHPTGEVSTYTYGFDTATQKTTVEINDKTAVPGHEKQKLYLTNQITVNGNNPFSATVWNQSSLICRMIKNGANEITYLNYSPSTTNKMVVYEGGNRLKYQTADWAEQFFMEDATLGASGGTVQLSGTTEPFFASHGNQAADAVKRTKCIIPGRFAPDGTWTWTTFDADTFPIRTDFTDGTYETKSYDANHNVLQHRDRAGRLVANTYDVRNNLLTRAEGTGADAGTATYTYYPAGHQNQFLLATSTDANGNTTDYAYDANQRLVSKTLPPDTTGGPRAVYAYTYDAQGRLSRSTDPVGRFTDYTYDAMNRVVRMDYCDVSFEQIVYGTGDNANRRIASRDRDGRWTAYRYDAAGRVSKTIAGISTQADATNPAFTPDPAFHTVTDNTYLYGTSRVATSTSNGRLTEYGYDYRNRLVNETVYSGERDTNNNLVGLTTHTVYLENKVFKTVDPYGRATYYNYRTSDYARVRVVQESTPGAAGSITTYAQVAALGRLPATETIGQAPSVVNAGYTVEDYELDASGMQTAVINHRGVRSETAYDSRGRAIQAIAAKSTPREVKTQTVYDANSNVIESRATRYFDTADADGQNKAHVLTTYTGRNLVSSTTTAPGTAEESKTTSTYYLDGKSKTSVLPNGNASGGSAANNTVTQMHRPLCGWSLGGIDQDGHGTLTNTSVGGDAIHTIQVKDLASLTTTLSNGYIVPNFLNEVNMDVPDANTLVEATTAYDSKHRPIASTTWNSPLAAVDRGDVPIFWNNAIQGGSLAQSAASGRTGQTTLYFYSEDISGGTVLTHPYGPTVDVASILAQATGYTQGTGAVFAARAVRAPNGEISVTILDGAGQTLVSGVIKP